MHIEKADAAKKAASENKEKDLIGARNAETESVFDKIGRDYAESSRQEKEDEKDDEWLREFETSLKEETGTKSYQSPITKAANTRNETFMKAYESGEKWLMSDGEDDWVKGFINRARSSVGKGVEDFAYMLNDIAPWYEPAKNVVEKNTAGSISAKADKQFENAKSRTGDFGDNLIDIADGAAETLGLSMFGPKALTYAFGTKEGFGEYRKQRENGVPEEVAFRRALAKAGYSVAVEKVDDYGINNILKGITPKVRFKANLGVLHGENNEFKSNGKYFENFFGEQKEITAKQHDEILQFRNCKNKIEIQNGLSYFPKNEIISENVKKVKPQKYNRTDTYYFDIGIHGNQRNVAFSSTEDAVTASPQTLAIIIAQSKNYKKRQPVRLLSCNTGAQIGVKECFAQELANILNAPVLAPNKYLFIDANGGINVGLFNEGEMNIFQPHYNLSKNDILNLNEENWRYLTRSAIK